MLFTHRGLSGPAILQISSYWREGEEIAIDMVPGVDVFDGSAQARASTPMGASAADGAGRTPAQAAGAIDRRAHGLAGNLADLSDKRSASRRPSAVNAWRVKPAGSEGYRTAEVTLGGVDTGGLDSEDDAGRKPCRACISSAKWSTSPAGWAATISSGPGRRAGGGAGGVRSKPPTLVGLADAFAPSRA